jgi:hypothetical protein
LATLSHHLFQIFPVSNRFALPLAMKLSVALLLALLAARVAATARSTPVSLDTSSGVKSNADLCFMHPEVPVYCAPRFINVSIALKKLFPALFYCNNVCTMRLVITAFYCVDWRRKGRHTDIS